MSVSSARARVPAANPGWGASQGPQSLLVLGGIERRAAGARSGSSSAWTSQRNRLIADDVTRTSRR